MKTKKMMTNFCGDWYEIGRRKKFRTKTAKGDSFASLALVDESEINEEEILENDINFYEYSMVHLRIIK